MANKNFFTTGVQTMNRFILIDTAGNHFDSSFHTRILLFMDTRLPNLSKIGEMGQSSMNVSATLEDNDEQPDEPVAPMMAVPS